MKKIYISGPMSGYCENNYPAFFKAELQLLRLGHEVVNPARVVEDVKIDGLTPEEAYEAYMEADLEALEECEAIYYLIGWNNSGGANREREKAVRLGLVEMFEQEKER